MLQDADLETKFMSRAIQPFFSKAHRSILLPAATLSSALHHALHPPAERGCWQAEG